MKYMKNKYGDENGNVVSFWSTDDNVLCEDGKTLRENLDEVDTQFKDIVKKTITTEERTKLISLKNYDDSEIKATINNKADKNEVFSMANMGQDIKEAMTGGSVAVVGRNSVTKDNIANEQVTAEKTNFIDTYSDNLLHKNNFTYGYAIKADTGELYALDTYATTDYVEVQEGESYKFGVTTNVAFFDENKKYVSGLPGASWSSPQTIPIGVKYVRQAIRLTELDSTYIIENKSGKTAEVDMRLNDKLIDGSRDKILNIEGIKIIKDLLCNNKLNLFEHLSDFRYTITSDNLVDERKMVEGAIRDTTGEVYNVANYKATDFIDIHEKKYICTSQQNNYAFYDRNKNYITGVKGGYSNPISIPTNAYYIRLSYKTTYGVKPQVNFGQTLLDYDAFKDEITLKDSTKLEPFQKLFKRESKLKGLKWNVLGDSITSVDYEVPNWWQQISSETGIIVNNYGVSGTSISKMDATAKAGLSFVERYPDMEDDVDLVTIMGGTNDYNAIMGDWDSTDITTFCGALNVLLQGVINKYPGKRIAFFLPIQQRDFRANSKNMINEFNSLKETSTLGSHELRTYIIKLKCEQYGIPYLDLFYQSGISGVDTNTIYYRDRLHPSALGQQRLKVCIQNYIKGLF